MSAPVRLQLSRRKGFSLQALSLATNGLPALKADRATRLGNPFPVTPEECTRAGINETRFVVGTWTGPAMWVHPKSRDEATDLSVKAYRAWITAPQNASVLAEAIETARGKNLACWCKLPAPGAVDRCHAAVLLELANRPICEAA